MAEELHEVLLILSVATLFLAAGGIALGAKYPELRMQSGFRVPRARRLGRHRTSYYLAVAESAIFAVADLAWVAMTARSGLWTYALVWWLWWLPGFAAVRWAYGYAEVVVEERWVKPDEEARLRARKRTRKALSLVLAAWLVGLIVYALAVIAY